MTETAPPQERPVTDRLLDLAVLNVVGGGGLGLGALALFLLTRLPALPYAQKTTTLRNAIYISAAGFLLAGLGFVFRGWKGWSASLRLFVVGTGTTGFAALVFQIGLIYGWTQRTLFVLLCFGAALLAAGLAIGRARRWGGYLELVITVAAAGGCWYIAEGITCVLVFVGFALLFVLFAFLDPLTVLFSAHRSGTVRILSRLSFTAWVILIILGGFLISIAASPNLMSAYERTRQRHTMADMRSIMQAVEKYAEVNKIFPATQDVADLARLLEPSYIQVLPRNDGWGKPLEYYRVTLPSGVQGFVVRAAGADGVFEHEDPTAYDGGPFEGFEGDIVFSTVGEQQWPEGQMVP